MKMYLLLRRVVDVVVSLFALIILLPLLVPLMLLLRVTGEGYVFYKQPRVGYKNQIFKIWKFATMLKDSPNMGTGDVTLRNDSRVTFVGKYLRKTKINELPQLINVLQGVMTLIGPRPLMEAGFNRYNRILKESVYNIKPGLTGIGSILFRDEEKLVTDSHLPPLECYERLVMPYKGALEIWYQNNMSFTIDLKIVFLTFWVILFPDSNLPKRVFKDLPVREF
ncbi:MAG: sugar transferase [Candidatus Scalindua sp.]|nr:sugar transferase [Candidatus Scalindua sp.]